MNIAITGASGHIGNNLCRELLKRGHHLKVLINDFDKSLAGLDVRKVFGSILHKETVKTLIEDSEYVFHSAALISIGNYSKKDVFDINIEGTRNVLEACSEFRIKRLIHFSSIHALSHIDGEEVLDEKNPLVGSEAFNYDQSKANSEKLVIEACSKGLNAIILNPSSVVGPNDFVPSLVGQMIIKIAGGNLPFLIKGGYHWVDVRDVVAASVNAMEQGKSGERYLLTSQWRSLLEIASIICTKMNRKVPGLIPDFIAWAGLPFIQLYSKISGSNALYTRESLHIVSHSPKMVGNQKAINELGFNPRAVEETFVDSLNWFINQGYIKNNLT